MNKPRIRKDGSLWLCEFVEKGKFVNLRSQAHGMTPAEAYENLCNYLRKMYL